MNWRGPRKNSVVHFHLSLLYWLVGFSEILSHPYCLSSII
ncbi:hypothetical protein Leryth_027347 [Lithospermum erythrorhizon]|nr:hypothetical protein Leryth_027347 [Lithospermum erythrorhizon]